jgi:hypothetical protein
MASQRLLAEIARRERLQEWIGGLEKRLSVERRFKTSNALRREIELCQRQAIALLELIDRWQAEESESQAS